MPRAGAAAEAGGPTPRAGSGGAGGAAAVSGDKNKRGVAYDFCRGFGAQGESDIELLRAGSRPGAGVTWFYNWGSTLGACLTSDAIEYVPMVWGLTNGGSACESGGVCFNDGLTIAKLLENIPQSARYLLGFNEPNFAHQANLTPTVAARAWKHLEGVAQQRSLALVSPATSYCDPNPSSDHAGSCTREPAEHTFQNDAYELTVPAGHRYNAFEWAELFYDECSARGAAGTNCRIDYQAGHVYSYWGLGWYVEVFKRKAGILPASEAHCKNGVKDEDEFAVNCGGNACAACSEWARAQFAKALWITELAPSTDDAPSPRPSREQLVAHAVEYIQTELPKLENDSYVFRYAWFMPRTDIGSLDHVDLLTEAEPAERTAVGTAYVDQAVAAR